MCETTIKTEDEDYLEFQSTVKNSGLRSASSNCSPTCLSGMSTINPNLMYT